MYGNLISFNGNLSNKLDAGFPWPIDGINEQIFPTFRQSKKGKSDAQHKLDESERERLWIALPL